MALQEALNAFYTRNPDVIDIFYATTPPYPIVKLLQEGTVRLGNLTLSVGPHVFLSPPEVMERLKVAGFLKQHEFLAQNQGSVLLALRYTRIFPETFDIIPLGGTKENPMPPPENLTARIHMGLIGDGGDWGE